MSVVSTYTSHSRAFRLPWQMAQLGRINQLIALYESDHGLVLDGGELGEILLPTREVPEGSEPGNALNVFISRDSEDRLVATTQQPSCQVGEIAALEVVSVHPRAGAFLDWNFPKDLLLPFKEQNHRIKEGEVAVVKVLHDEVSDRIIATSKINRFLNQSRPHYKTGDPVALIIQERTPLGYMAVIDQRFNGLIHESSLQHPIRIGESFDGFIAAVKPDGKIDLSLEKVGYGRVTQLTDRILEALEKNNGRIPLTDKSSPGDIRRAFGASKKAFKQALGALYRQRRISLENNGISLARKSGN